LTRQGSLAPFGALCFAYFASIGLFNPYAPLWFQSLGYSTLAIGAIASLQSWTRVVAPYGWSWLGDHWHQGQRRHLLLRIASGLTLLFALGLLVTREYAAVAVVVTLVYLANAGVMPLTEAALAQRLATAGGLDVGRYGRVRAWGSLGFIVVVVVSGALLQWVGIAALPWLTVVLLSALLLASWRLPPAPPAVPAAPTAAAPGVWAVLRQPAIAWFFAGTVLTVLAHTSLYAFLSLYLVDLGYGKSAVGALWAVSVAAEIAFFWTQAHWFSRWNAQTWLLVAAAVAALRFTAMALLGGSAVVLVLTQATHAVTFAAHHAACIATVDRNFPGRLRGRGQALYSTLGYGVSGVLGGLAGGAFSQRWGFPAVFAAAALVAAAGFGCYWRARVLGRPVAPAAA